MTMLRTLQIVGNSSYGGASYLILEWCKFLVDQGCQVDILATDPYFCSKLSEVAETRIFCNILIPREIEPIEDIKALSELIILLRQERYDVVHTYTATPGFLGRIAARLARVPVVLHHQAGWTVTEFSSFGEKLLYLPLEYLATLASTKSICVSHAVARQAAVLGMPRHKLVTICNGIAPEPFLAATRNGLGREFRRSLKIPEEYIVIGGTGRLAPQKDNSTLIRSLVALKGFLPSRRFCLVLAGDGPEKQELEDLSRSLGVSEQVRFLGFYKDIPRLLDGVDIFVSTSLWEGLSISLLEAMASAKPIVATNILPNAELIEHEVTGLLVPPKNPEEVAKAIVRFVNDPDLAQRCGIAARQRVLDRYTIERMFQETWDLYLQLLKEKGHGEG